MLSKADSYVRLHVKGPNKSKTEVIMNDNDPTWNQSLYMLVDDVQERKLAIEVMDSDETAWAKISAREQGGAPPRARSGGQRGEGRVVRVPRDGGAQRSARPPLRANLEITYVPFDVDGAGSSAMSAPARRGNAHRASHPSERAQGCRFERHVRSLLQGEHAQGGHLRV